MSDTRLKIWMGISIAAVALYFTYLLCIGLHFR